MNISSTFALVIDDHPLIARGVAEYLRARCGYTAARDVNSIDQAFEVIAEQGMPKLIVLDFWLSDKTALELIDVLKARCPDSLILIMTGEDDPALLNSVMHFGVHGFIHKNVSSEEFAQAVCALDPELLLGNDPDNLPDWKSSARRDVPITPAFLGLTPRQGQTLDLILRGHPNKKIATLLAISEETVKEHVNAVFNRLGVQSRIELLILFRGRKIELQEAVGSVV